MGSQSISAMENNTVVSESPFRSRMISNTQKQPVFISAYAHTAHHCVFPLLGLGTSVTLENKGHSWGEVWLLQGTWSEKISFPETSPDIVILCLAQPSQLMKLLAPCLPVSRQLMAFQPHGMCIIELQTAPCTVPSLLLRGESLNNNALRSPSPLGVHRLDRENRRRLTPSHETRPRQGHQLLELQSRT